ncbi:MAG: MiaB/RimO family radical SAM methylthiotransferase, partial [Synergistaceae bacterium]|nr:MiaB/RimO family radical SAM methylthiotransferase [Synergistaceae bacterium]
MDIKHEMTIGTPLHGKTFSIIIQGCRTNQYEGDSIAAMLEKAGAVHNESGPDIAVIVSCTITAVTDRKCRKILRRLRRENHDAVIVACGCYAQKMTEEERVELGVDIVVGNRLKYKLPQLLAEHFVNATNTPQIINDKYILSETSWDHLELDKPRLHSRAFLKVQDGCSHYCSYCIVPYVRGKPVSRDMDGSVAEAKKIVESGCPEVVLTGVHIGLYENLPELVKRIGSINGLHRLRFGSIEPFAVTNELLSVLADTPTFCRHLHMPLQSGDDNVLASMRRGYTSKEFAAIAANARKYLGDEAHISTDLMVGFPTEDDSAFRNSVDFIKEIRFGKIHVFPYSPREGTDAASMKQIPASAVKERVKEALETAEGLHREYCSRWIGKSVSILVEE